ncbi:MAG: hypothetical protein L0H93_07860 [Nocardioides sp.]|nr:hypothetical protein [Nocardioides sp.]
MRTAAQEAIASTGEFPIELFSVGLARGTVLHLFDESGPRVRTLCNRRIGTNPRYLGIGSSSIRSSDEATCKRCVKAAAALQPAAQDGTSA